MTLEIYELGVRQKRAQFVIADDVTDPDVVAFEIYMAAMRMKACASRNLGATWDPNTNTGTIVAGFRAVGKVRKLK
jgi:hypothetical protein